MNSTAIQGILNQTDKSTAPYAELVRKQIKRINDVSNNFSSKHKLKTNDIETISLSKGVSLAATAVGLGGQKNGAEEALRTKGTTVIKNTNKFIRAITDNREPNDVCTLFSEKVEQSLNYLNVKSMLRVPKEKVSKKSENKIKYKNS